jgi:hypothetical protein
MSNFSDGYARNGDLLVDDTDWANKMAAKYPNLVTALLGQPGSGGEKVNRPPLSLIIGVKEGRLRGSLSSAESARTYFFPIDDPAEPLEAAERALAGNTGEWVTKRVDTRKSPRF